MKHVPFILIFAAIINFFLLGQPVQAGDDPNATPEPSLRPMSLNDPNYQIIKTVNSPINDDQLHLVTEKETDPESIFCGGWSSNCFLFINDSFVEPIQFISIFNGQEENEFRGRTLEIESLGYLEDGTITFKTVFADAQTSATAQYCFAADHDLVELVETRLSQYDTETDTLNQTVDVYLDAFCAPVLFPHKTFMPILGRPF